ncbi:glycosyltransferase family 4 protein [Silvanigrella aquatica]|uniref:Glycosyl transferase family 1 domain-containing protein n=1 Tax=Silvanigrella aquatica TaxID=1915309 RepID=A0A1L4CZA3_9BACT|nr:glycosyltransferase family 1 protein [Silvanigrella aquatica]APJ03293.1 hypothetical protein AXG55_05000 [Silvanigrella aquatica]
MSSDKKTIMLDARIVVKDAEHGIARHIRELIFNIINCKDHENFNFILVTNANSPFNEYKLPSNFLIVTLKFGTFSFLGQFEIIFTILKYKPKLFHSPHFIVPLLSSIPLIATIHDMNHMALSNNYSLIQKIYYNIFLKRKLLKAKSIITVSNFSKNEIIKYLGLPNEKIHVFYNGVYNNFQPAEAFNQEKVHSVVFKHKLPPKYIFTIGNNKPHKNLERLTEAYCTGNFKLPLVILTQNHTSLLEISKKYGKHKDVHFVDFVKEEDFPLIYSLCSSFVYVSLYEGFGLPPIEAAACGVPVVISNTTSLPEIMEDVAIYVDPLDIKDIQRGIHESLDEYNPNLKKNVQNGLQLSKKYSWERMAQETLTLYGTLQ